MRYPTCILLLSGLSGVCFGQVEFVGFTETSEGRRFILRDAKEKQPSDLLRLEQSFRGVKLLAYDPEGEVLTVEKQGDRFQLPLRAPRVQSGAASHELPDSPRKYKVGSIIIRPTSGEAGAETVIRDAMQIRPGGTFDEQSLDKDIRSIYRTGQFKHIEVKHEKRSDEAFDLVVIVTPKPLDQTPKK